MSSQPAVVVENVGKCYHIYGKNIDRLKQALTLGGKKLYHEFWALRDISFTVERGQTLGIVGANGSGKSTLLQLLFGVLHPSSGTIGLSGKVGGLLELAGGFNPEETGRENVLINASILGVPPRDVPQIFEQIAAFADIGQFMDQPLKVYSSGMAVRLAFALQIGIPCDILIIDEALAVGDELFQHRCYVALEKFRADGGTILFVSHSVDLVKQMCNSALFLDHGRLVQHGSAKIVADNYQKFLHMREPEGTIFREQLMQGGAAGEEAAPTPSDIPASASAAGAWDQSLQGNAPPAEFDATLAAQTPTVYQSLGAVLSKPRIETLSGQVVNVLNPQQRYRYCYRVEFQKDARDVVLGWLVKSNTGVELGGGAQDSSDGCLQDAPAGAIFDVGFEFNACLYPGLYYLNCGVTGMVGDYSGFLHRIVDAVAFRVRDGRTKIHTGFVDMDYRGTLARAAT